MQDYRLSRCANCASVNWKPCLCRRDSRSVTVTCPSLFLSITTRLPLTLSKSLPIHFLQTQRESRLYDGNVFIHHFSMFVISFDSHLRFCSITSRSGVAVGCSWCSWSSSDVILSLLKNSFWVRKPLLSSSYLWKIYKVRQQAFVWILSSCLCLLLMPW